MLLESVQNCEISPEIIRGSKECTKLLVVMAIDKILYQQLEKSETEHMYDITFLCFSMVQGIVEKNVSN